MCTIDEAELDAMPEGERASLGEVRLNPKLPRAVLSQKAPGWGAVCCGNHGCLTLLFPGRSPIRTRCSRCQYKASGGGSGTTQTPIDVHIANQKAVDRDEVKMIDHLRDRHGEVVKDPFAPLSPWARLAAAWKIVWTGMVERAAPIEVEVPGGTSPACITVRASPFSSFNLL